MSSPANRTLNHSAYTVALICPLEVEMSAARYMLDEEHLRLPKERLDTNSYVLGRLSGHNVVIAYLPEGSQGTASAATVATHLARTFPMIKLRLLVGIGGGVPSDKNDIRLGDVIVSTPVGTSGGVVEYDLGRDWTTGFERKGLLCPPPAEWRSVMTRMKSDHRTRPNRIGEFLTNMLQSYPQLAEYRRPSLEKDVLFLKDYEHNREHTTCGKCNKSKTITREQRPAPDEPVVFYGLIASGNRVMKNAIERDNISRDSGGAICFEMEAAGLMNDFQCVVIRGIADYCDSHKNDEWHPYASAAAAGFAKEMLLHVDPIIEEQEYSAQKARKLNLLEKLYTSPYRDRKDRNPERVDGTCEWFNNHSYFHSWKASTISSLLWVSADPGCGKSVLAKYLVDAILPSTKSRTTCYFFFKDDFEDQRDAASAFCCILRQIFMQNDALLSDEILEKFEADGEKLIGSFRDLWDILISVAKNYNSGEIICILDALDECEDKGRSQIAELLSTFYGTERNRFKLKFLLTSRPYAHIQREFQILENRLPTIHLSGESEFEVEKISQEVKIFIKSRVANIGDTIKLDVEERQLLQDELLSIPNRTYLWVHLTLDVVQNSLNITKGSIIANIKRLPRTVDEAYERILSRSHDLETARRLLHIVVAATRPFSLKEMSLALAIRGNHRSYSDVEIEPEGRFRNTVRELCGLFVTVVDAKIYLLHQTAKEFLVQNSNDPTNSPARSCTQWKFSLWPGDSNRILAEICIRYLLFREFETSSLGADTPDQVLLDYSAKHWATHYREAYILKEMEIKSMVMKLCDASSQICETWFRIFWTTTYMNDAQNFTGLMIASYLGLEFIVKLLLETDTVDLDSTDTYHERSALSWAAHNGYAAVVELLLKKRAPVGSNPIFMLFRKRAKIDLKDYYNQTPLSLAVENGHKAVAHLLLAYKANIETRDDFNRTPLLWAVENGHEAIAHMLLAHKANIEARNKNSQTPLLSAAEEGHTTIARLLLTYKADIEARGGNNRTPLIEAIKNVHMAIIHLLLVQKADVNARDDSNQTPLLWAAHYGNVRVARLLLAHKASIEARDDINQTPLLLAVRKGHEAFCQLLLTYKADIEARDARNMTPLMWAARQGFEAIVQLLLEYKADVEARDHLNRTPLLLAAEHGHAAVAQLLLAYRADVDTRDDLNQIPLSLAAEHGHADVAQLLREHMH